MGVVVNAGWVVVMCGFVGVFVFAVG